MSTMMEITCHWCGEKRTVRAAEIWRQQRKGCFRTFCSSSCASQFGNETSGRKSKSVTKVCPTCKKTFLSSTRRRAPTFCSHACASSGSLTAKRMESARRMGKQNVKNFTLLTQADGLRKREAWRYAAVEQYLKNVGEPYRFEFPLIAGHAIFDLALIRRKLFVEFDGPGHEQTRDALRDREKDAAAKKEGWTVVRISTSANLPLHPSVLDGILTGQPLPADQPPAEV